MSEIHRFACDAMAATFGVAIRGQEERYARQAAHAALEETGRIEKELSRFIPSSDVSRINRLRRGEAARVGIAAFECLQLAKAVCKETGGAFDVSLGTGLDRVSLDRKNHSVRVEEEGVTLDFGGIGKGYAVDQVAAVLKDWSIEDALVHAGESTALAMGSWPVEIRNPENQARALKKADLRSRALSGSGVQLQGEHIIDPRTGKPVRGRLGAWAAAPTAALSDALSTAFMVMAVPEEVEKYCTRHKDISALILTRRRKLLYFGAPWS
ncbi:MAG: FAD:protein FMN transferase [Planctomycetes bacterium]|nr:FAD:protein FMN transferase [Planctomycetota bacterium]